MTTASAAPLVRDLRGELEILVRLSIPIAVAQFGLIAMGLVDTAIIGRTSVDDLAATAMARSIVFMVSSFGMGVTLALDPLAAQAIGAGRPDRAWSALRATLAAGAAIALPSVAIAFGVTLLLEPLGVDPALLPRVRAYLAGYAPSIFLFIAYLAGKSFLQAHGETRTAIVAAVVGNVINAVACLLLVMGDDALRLVRLAPLGLPRFGALGAGLSSTLGTAVLAGIVLVGALRYRAPLPPDAIPAVTVFRLGIPVGLQLLAEIGVFSLCSLIVGRLGSKVVSAHQIALSLASFTFMGALGVGGATAVRVGHAVGAGVSPRRAGFLGLGLGALAMSGGAVVFALAPRWLIGLFTEDAEVIEVGSVLLRIAALFQLFDGIQAVAGSALRGAGDVRAPFVLAVTAHWLVGLPVALGLAFGLRMGAAGIWWGFTAGLFAVAALLSLRFSWLSGRPVRRIE